LVKWYFREPDVQKILCGGRASSSSGGSTIRVLSNVAEVEELAQGHGGWNSRMAAYCGQAGTIKRTFEASGDTVSVRFPDRASWSFNKAALEPVAVPGGVAVDGGEAVWQEQQQQRERRQQQQRQINFQTPKKRQINFSERSF
jgi:hypothetical protein